MRVNDAVVETRTAPCSLSARVVRVLATDLRGTDDGLAGRVAAANHHLLGDEDFLCRDLNPQVAPGNHHPVTLGQDFLKTGRRIEGRRSRGRG